MLIYILGLIIERRIETNGVPAIPAHDSYDYNLNQDNSSSKPISPKKAQIVIKGKIDQLDLDISKDSTSKLCN